MEKKERGRPDGAKNKWQEPKMADVVAYAMANHIFCDQQQAEWYLRSVYGAPASKGRNLIIKHLSGQKLSGTQAGIAKCCDCCGYYVDGRSDCRVKLCTLYPRMPYRGKQ